VIAETQAFAFARCAPLIKLRRHLADSFLGENPVFTNRRKRHDHVGEPQSFRVANDSGEILVEKVVAKVAADRNRTASLQLCRKLGGGDCTGACKPNFFDATRIGDVQGASRALFSLNTETVELEAEMIAEIAGEKRAGEQVDNEGDSSEFFHGEGFRRAS